MPKSERLSFEASAHLQTLLGRELFRSEEFAIVELVKNAYDSGARNVEVFISPISKSRIDEIIIADDGSGMSRSDIQRLFMVAGYSERGEADRSGRVPTGEKGVGRFAADRLGKSLDVYTRASGSASILHVTIDWTKFGNRSKRFNEITADIKEVTRRPREIAKVGTVLQIGRLRSKWSTSELKSLRQSLEQLFDPYDPPGDFALTLTVEGAKSLSGVISPARIARGDLEVRFDVRSKGIVRRIWKASSKVEEREAAPTDRYERLLGLQGTFVYYLKKPRSEAVAGLTAGVRLYRDGFRIEPFGHPTADWLGIGEKRAKRAGHAHIVPTRLFGFVSIQRAAHSDLRDTTSREALIDTPSAKDLLGLLREELAQLEERIRKDVTEPRWTESRLRQAQEIESARLELLRILSDGLAHELRQPLQVIRSEADNIAKRLKRLGIKDAELDESRDALDQHVRRIDENVQFLTSISTGNLEDATQFDLADLVKRECTLFERRCRTEGVTLTYDVPESQPATLNQPTVAMVVGNLIANALDALSSVSGDKRPKRIVVTVSRESRAHTIFVRDSGDGIPKDLQPRIFRRFVTGKTGGHGIGLSYCKSIVEAQGGTIQFKTALSRGTTFTVSLPDKARRR